MGDFLCILHNRNLFHDIGLGKEFHAMESLLPVAELGIWYGVTVEPYAHAALEKMMPLDFLHEPVVRHNNPPPACFPLHLQFVAAIGNQRRFVRSNDAKSVRS
jgi:hypothetical protein